MYSCCICLFMFVYLLHTVFRVQQGRHGEPSIKTSRFPLSTEFFEALRVEWWNLAPGLGAKVKKCKYKKY